MTPNDSQFVQYVVILHICTRSNGVYMFFAQNKVKSAVSAIRKLKFIKPVATAIPILPTKRLPTGSAVTHNTWQISNHRIYRTDIQWHLALHDNTRVEPVEFAIQLVPCATSSPLEYIRISFHKKYQVSIMAMAKVGVGNQLLSSISADQDTVLNSPFICHYLPSVGADSRARAGMLINIRDNGAIDALHHFMSLLNDFYAFDHDALSTCHDAIMLCHKHAKTLEPWPIEPQSEHRTSCLDLKEYPHGLPDGADLNNNLFYNPSDTIAYPHNIPIIHSQILYGSKEAVIEQLRKTPALHYVRDARGFLPITIAMKIGKFELAAEMFLLWYNLPYKDRYLDNIIIKAANLLTMKPDAVSEEKRQAFINDHILQEITPRPHIHQRILAGERIDVKRFIGEEQALNNTAKKFYDLALATAKSCKAVIESIRPENQKHRYYRTLAKELKNDEEVFFKTLESELISIVEWIVIVDDDLELLQERYHSSLKIINHANQLLKNKKMETSNTSVLHEYFTKLYAIKQSAISEYQHIRDEYRTHCCQPDEYEFTTWTYVLAVLSTKSAYLSVFPDINIDIDWPISSLRQKMEESSKPLHVQMVKNLRKPFEHRYPMLIRQGLLSHEAQDAWGYTPLLLAISMNHLETVKSYLSNGLICDKIFLRNNSHYGMYYTPLEHARTPEMIELLMSYYYSKNQFSDIESRGDISLTKMLKRYHYQPTTESFKTSVIQSILLGTSKYDNPAEVLKQILRYSDEEFIHGPFDDYVDDSIIKVITEHNDNIQKKIQGYQRYPKLESMEPVDNAIISHFKNDVYFPNQTFTTRLVHVDDILDDWVLREQLASLFAQRFKLAKDDSIDGRIAFFQEYLENHQDFSIEIYEGASGKTEGFCTFLLKDDCPDNPNIENNPITLYFSIAATSDSSPPGFPQYTTRVIYPAWEKAQKEGRKLRFYSRFGRPGLALTLIPREAKISYKYIYNPYEMQWTMYSVAGDILNSNGTSTPPALSLGIRSKLNDLQLEEYDYLMNKKLGGAENESLPLIFDIDDETIAAWKKLHVEKNGMNNDQIEEFCDAFENFHENALKPKIYARL